VVANSCSGGLCCVVCFATPNIGVVLVFVVTIFGVTGMGKLAVMFGAFTCPMIFVTVAFRDIGSVLGAEVALVGLKGGIVPGFDWLFNVMGVLGAVSMHFNHNSIWGRFHAILFFCLSILN